MTKYECSECGKYVYMSYSVGFINGAQSIPVERKWDYCMTCFYEVCAGFVDVHTKKALSELEAQAAE